MGLRASVDGTEADRMAATVWTIEILTVVACLKAIIGWMLSHSLQMELKVSCRDFGIVLLSDARKGGRERWEIEGLCIRGWAARPGERRQTLVTQRLDGGKVHG